MAVSASVHLTGPAHDSIVAGGVRSDQIHANGLDFAIFEAGNGLLVLCLHGFPDYHGNWAHFLGRFASEGYRAVAPALRGYWSGGSAPDGAYRAWTTGQDVLTLIEALGSESAIVIGHDIGARAAYAAASVNPERVKKLVGPAVPHGRGLTNAVVAGGTQQRRSWYMLFFQSRFAEAAVKRNDFAFLDRFCKERSAFHTLGDAERNALHDTFDQPGVLTPALGYCRQLFMPPTEMDALPIEMLAIRPISVPYLYIHGSGDGCTSNECSENMGEMFVNEFKHIVLSDVGHFLHLEQPEAVLNHILPFIKS